MRTLLRNIVTGLYVQGPDKWTSNPEQALDFRFKDLAVKRVEAWHLREVELAFHLDHSQQLLATMPLGEVFPRSAAA